MFSVGIPRDNDLDTVLSRAMCKIKDYCLYFHGPRFDGDTDCLFFRKFGRKHEVLFEVLDDPSVQKVLVLAHRGFGKSTIVNKMLSEQSVLFDKYKFIVPASGTATMAEQFSEEIKSSFLTDDNTGTPRNPRVAAAVKYLYGLDSIASTPFSQKLWKTALGGWVFPRSPGAQIRGVNLGGNRLQLGLFDDIENAEEVLSLEQRVKLRNWLFDDAAKSVDMPSKNWRLIVIGTILSENAVLQDLREDPRWTLIDLPLCDENYKSYWPAYMTDDQIKDMVDDHKDRKAMGNFDREMRNIPVPTDDAPFKREHFVPYNEAELAKRKDFGLETVVIVDPARTIDMKNAKSAIVGGSVDMSEGLIYFRDIVSGHFYLDETIDHAFAMADRLGTLTIGVEDIGSEDLIRQPFMNEAMRRGKSYNFVWLKGKAGKIEADSAVLSVRGASGEKDRRIAQLLPFYRLGQVRHNPYACAELEEQLLSFPRAKYNKKDVMDAASYIVQMLRLGERFFMSQRKMIAKDSDAETLESEDEMLERLRQEDLEDDLALEAAYG